MNKLVLTNSIIEPSTLQPFTAPQLNWLQTNVDDLTIAFTQGIVGANNIYSPMVVSGQHLFGTNGIKQLVSGTIFNYSPCWIYYPPTGEPYYFSGATNLDASLGEHFSFVSTYPNAADPIIFSDGTTHNVMQENQFILSNSVTGQLFDFSDLTSSRGEWKVAGTAFGGVAYQNGWQGGLFQPGALLEYKFNNMSQKVELQGTAVNATSGNNTTIITLPVGMRPPSTRMFSCIGDNIAANSKSAIMVQITPNGNVTPLWLTSLPSDLVVHFEGIFFDVLN